MFCTFALITALAASPSSGAARSKPNAPAASARAGTQLEVLIPERMLEDFLQAAAPFERTIQRQIGAFGLGRTVDLHLRLTNPKVKVTPEAIYVTLDYQLTGPGGLSSTGRATPKMVLRPLPDSGLLEGRLTGASLSVTGGLEIPTEELVDPVQFPASASGPLEVGEATVMAEGRARDVVLEPGRIRVKGAWSFSRAPATAGAGAETK